MQLLRKHLFDQKCTLFSLVVEAVGNENISSARICGMDESVLTAVQKPARIFVCRGQNKKRNGALTGAVTVVAYASSTAQLFHQL
jgi:hypothetical protein